MLFMAEPGMVSPQPCTRCADHQTQIKSSARYPACSENESQARAKTGRETDPAANPCCTDIGAAQNNKSQSCTNSAGTASRPRQAATREALTGRDA
jgi:hypothetical protein